MNLSSGNRAVLALAAMTLAQAAVGCDYCLISQGVSPLDTVNGRGLRVAERYTTLDRVYDGSRERANPGASETYYTTEVTGFWDPRPWLTLIAVAPLRVTEVDGHLEHHGAMSRMSIQILTQVRIRRCAGSRISTAVTAE